MFQAYVERALEANHHTMVEMKSRKEVDSTGRGPHGGGNGRN